MFLNKITQPDHRSVVFGTLTGCVTLFSSSVHEKATCYIKRLSSDLLFTLKNTSTTTDLILLTYIYDFHVISDCHLLVVKM